MRLLLFVLFCFPFALLHAQNDDNLETQTLHLSNGRLWLLLSPENREVYLAAIRDSTRVGAAIGGERPHRCNGTSIRRALGTGVHAWRDYETELNKFFDDTENIRIPIVLAMRYCSAKLKGNLTKSELEQGHQIITISGAFFSSKNPMSKDATAILDAMREAGLPLVGSIGDYGRSFRLERDGTWDDVSFSIAQELIEAGSIRPVLDRGAGQLEYRAATD